MPLYTEEDYVKAAEHYATLSYKELRKYQAITQAQIPLAFKKGLIDTLAHLQRTDDLVTQAIYNISFTD